MQPIRLRGKLTSRCGRWQLFVESFFCPDSVSRDVIFSPICTTKSTHTGFSSPRPPWAAQSIWRLGTSGAVNQGKGQRDGPSEDYLSKSQLGPRDLYVLPKIVVTTHALWLFLEFQSRHKLIAHRQGDLKTIHDIKISVKSAHHLASFHVFFPPSIIECSIEVSSVSRLQVHPP